MSSDFWEVQYNRLKAAVLRAGHTPHRGDLNSQACPMCAAIRRTDAEARKESA